MTTTSPTQPMRQKSGSAHLRGLRSSLVVATALAGGAAGLFALTTPAVAQTVLLAPKGSHKQPSAQLPVYVGADLGQDAPAALSTPPQLRNPVSLSPNSVQAAAPATDTALPVAADTTVSAPPPSLPLPAMTPTRTVRPRVVIAATPAATAPAPVASATTAESLNASEYDKVARQPLPARRVVAAGDTPRYTGAPASSIARDYDVLPENLRYRPKASDAQYRPRQAVQTVDTTPSDDVPLATVGRVSGLATGGGGDTPRLPLYEPSGAVLVQNDPSSRRNSPLVVDPITRDIDRSIAQLRASLAPSFQFGVGYQGHSGTPGESRLNTYLTPMEATFSPGGMGQMKLTVTPTMMMAGTLSGNTYTSQTFGQMAFGVKGGTVSLGTYTPPTYSGKSPGAQTAFGTSVDAQYSLGQFTGDLGTTPFGFQEQNFVGGLQWLPALSNTTNLRLVGERRAVTESFLSYGGMQDPYTGKRWGGVVRDTGRVSLETRQGRWNIYALLGASLYTGSNVADNSMYEAAAGATYPIWKYMGEELRTGIDLHYNAFEKNLRYFTYGQGGYFSPQRELTALIPIIFHNQVSRDLSYELRGSVGYQQFGESRSAYFPNDPALQAALVTAAASSPSLSTYFAGQRSSGITGGFGGELNYRITPAFSIGARGAFSQSGVYQEYNGSVFARYVLNGLYDQ